MIKKNDYISDIPHLPGIYVFKSTDHTILYIGKAKDLQKRIRSYFTKQATDWKVAELIKEHETIGYVITKNEIEALLLEAHLIRKYIPKYNVLLKSGQPFLYLLFTPNNECLPQLLIVRNKKQKGTYFGPFLHKQDARAVYDYLVRTFQLFACNKKIENGCLDYHLGKCCGSCRPDFDKEAYLSRLELAKNILQGNHKKFLAQLKNLIQHYNEHLEFEKSARLHSYIENFETIFSTLTTKFNEHKYQQEIESITQQHVSEQESQQALLDLQYLLHLEEPITTIDCFDISHFQSHNIVGSCIRFTNGKKDPKKFRHFKITSISTQNDYAALQEIVRRRYKNPDELPDIVLIDGGKGQRNAVLPFLSHTPCISLAKREEELFTAYHPNGIHIDIKTPLGKLLISLRDYAHHFAITFQRKRRSF